MKKCHNCNRSKIVDGYSETIVTSIGVETKYYCHECLTVYAEKNVVYHSVYTPKLRDTKIDEYNAVINDFKSVEGDSKLGLNSLPVIFGIKNASRISAGLIDVFQLAMVVVLILIGQNLASVILVLLVIPQITFQDMWLLRDPLKFDVKYQASAQPFLITGMLVTALAIGHSFLVA